MTVAALNDRPETTLPTDGASRPKAAREDGLALGTSVGKALAVLEAFRGGSHLLGVSQIAERAHIPKSTAHRLLSVLVEHNFVDRIDARYQLGLATFELGNLVAECRPRSLRSVAMPYLADLHRAADATAHLAVLEGLDVVYVDKIYGHRGVDVPSRVGGRVPALCTALGKAMIAFSAEEMIERALASHVPRLTARTMTNPAILRAGLSRTRETGLAYDIEGSSLGAHCIAAPIMRRSSSEVLGAISLTFSLTDKPTVALETSLVKAAAAISLKCT